MDLPDYYRTIAAPATGEFKDRGSKFIAYAFPVSAAEEVAECLLQVKKEHPKARHHCYAYRLGLDQYNYRANDDGEPSGTAGRPILGQIDSHGVTNTLVVVVRYFGGTLLGASGLIQAYKLSAADALSQTETLEKPVEKHFTLCFDYALMSLVMQVIARPPFRITDQRFHETAEIDVALVLSAVEAAFIDLKATVAGVYPEEVPGLESIPGFDIVEKEGIVL
ncbi:MAG: YigZ family protein [Saprospiraceae bacterium]